MRSLLDTHAFIWWTTNDPQLSSTASNAIANSSNAVFLSVASAWEITIKVKTGKLILPSSPQDYIPSRIVENSFEILSIELAHVLTVWNLPAHHRDPFDRILVA